MKLPWRHVNQTLGGFIVARFHFQSSNLRLLVAEFQLLNQTTNRDPLFITILTHESIKGRINRLKIKMKENKRYPMMENM